MPPTRGFSNATSFAARQSHRPARPSPLLASASLKFAAPLLPGSSLAARRFQSTSTSESPTAIADDFPGASDLVAAAPPSADHIGFTKEYGLDFGWGTSSIIQSLFEHIHVYSGLPFWASIVATAVAVRLSMVPFLIKASESSQKMAALAPELKPLTEKMKVAVAAQDQLGMSKTRREMSLLREKHGIKLVWTIMPALLQIPLGFSLWRLTRRMAEANIVGLQDGGVLWFTNLAAADPLFLLPALVAGLQYRAVKTSFEQQPDSPMLANPLMKNVFLFGLPALALPIIGFAPAAVQLNFTVTAAMALGTNLLLRNPAFRDMMRMAPVYKKPPPAKAYAGTLNLSRRATDHPDNIRAAKQAAEENNRLAAQKMSFAEKYSPAKLSRDFQTGMGSLRDSVDNIMPGVKSRQDKYLDKHRRQKAEGYESKRRAEIDRMIEARKAGRI